MRTEGSAQAFVVINGFDSSSFLPKLWQHFFCFSRFWSTLPQTWGKQRLLMAKKSLRFLSSCSYTLFLSHWSSYLQYIVWFFISRYFPFNWVRSSNPPDGQLHPLKKEPSITNPEPDAGFKQLWQTMRPSQTKKEKWLPRRKQWWRFRRRLRRLVWRRAKRNRLPHKKPATICKQRKRSRV